MLKHSWIVQQDNDLKHKSNWTSKVVDYFGLLRRERWDVAQNP